MQQPEPKKIWYLPHHPVVNLNKPVKVSRVANTAAMFKGQSSNSNLITGPDLLNNLVGILLKFHENPVAIRCRLFQSVPVAKTDLYPFLAVCRRIH